MTSSLKISSKLLKDLQLKNIPLDISRIPLGPPKPATSKPVTPPPNPSLNSSDSLEKTNTTLNFKIRPCTPNPDSLTEKKESATGMIRSAKTTLSTFPVIRKEIKENLDKYEDFAIPELDETLFSREINEETLAGLIGADPCEFCDLKKLTLKVDLSLNSLQNLGSLLPNLRELKINGSKLGSLRDIGTSLVNLEVLWASRCGMQDLSGILMFQRLKELYLAFNHIGDLSDIGFLDGLQVLDLEGNEIDRANLEHLIPLKRLYSLNLIQNPVYKHPEYPKLVLEGMEHLQILDEKPRKSLLTARKAHESRDLDVEEIESSMDELLGKFGRFGAEINIQAIRDKAESLFESSVRGELKEEDLILYSIKRSKKCDSKVEDSRPLANPLETRPKTANIFRADLDPRKNFDNGMSSLVSSNDVAFFGNPLKIFKHKRTAQTAKNEDCEVKAQDLMALIDEFKVENSDVESLDSEEMGDSEGMEDEADLRDEGVGQEMERNAEKIAVEKPKIIEMPKRPTLETKPLKNARSMEETKSAMFSKFRPEVKNLDSERISAIISANKEKMKKNLGNLLQASKNANPTNTRLKIRQNILKNADSFHRKSGTYFSKEGKDLKAGSNNKN